MRILVLGGTSFVGRAIVTDLVRRGDDVTLFTRGRTGPELFPTVARHHGDRASGDYGALDGGSWDAVVDVTAYIPRHVQQAGAVLTGRVQRSFPPCRCTTWTPLKGLTRKRSEWRRNEAPRSCPRTPTAG